MRSEVRDSVDLLFRRRAGQLTATLTRVLGIDQLDLVDDVVQHAFVQALRTWSYRGVPENPSAWILRVAKNRAVDELRRQGRWREKRETLERSLLPETAGGTAFFSTELDDDQLRMVFACCHASLSRDAQVALTLKTVGGFSVEEIGRLFLTAPSTIAQRIVRAKRTLRDAGATLEIPVGTSLPPHRDAVLEVVYLMFTEGYAASAGDDLVRVEVCSEAVRLAELLAGHPTAGGPAAHALTALLLFQSARLPARVDGQGELVRLDRQDRSRYDRAAVRRAVLHLQRAARGEVATTYHLQAEIAAHHTLADRYEATDWTAIRDCYDALVEIDESPVVALNRVVAVARVDGPEAGLRALDALRDEPVLQTYYPRFAIEGDLLLELERRDEAERALSQAIALARSKPVRRYLERRIAELEVTA